MAVLARLVTITFDEADHFISGIRIWDDNNRGRKQERDVEYVSFRAKMGDLTAMV